MEGLSPRLRKMLVTGVVDVAVLSLNVDPAHLILGASFTEPISLVGAKGDPLLDGDEPLTLAEIVDLPLIIAGIRREGIRDIVERSEEHPSELQALLRSSYAGLRLKKT